MNDEEKPEKGVRAYAFGDPVVSRGTEDVNIHMRILSPAEGKRRFV